MSVFDEMVKAEAEGGEKEDRIAGVTPGELIKKAIAARDYAYSPYSHFAVGAAILCEDGSIFTGCNVENASYGATICAERTAATKAVSFGYTHFLAVAVVGGPADGALIECPPCGVCRQFLSEFATAGIRVFIATSERDYREETFGALLPLAFSL